MPSASVFISSINAAKGILYHNNFFYIGINNNSISQYNIDGTLVRNNWASVPLNGMSDFIAYGSYMYINSANSNNIFKVKINSDGSADNNDTSVWYDGSGTELGLPLSMDIYENTMYISLQLGILKTNMLTSDVSANYTVLVNGLGADSTATDGTYLYASPGNRIVKINLTTGQIIDQNWVFFDEGAPRGIIIYDGYMYVAHYVGNPNSGFISRINLTTKEVELKWSIVEYEPARYAIFSLEIYNGYLYTSSQHDGSVYRIALPLPLPVANICFVEGTLVMTDQGIIPIETVTKDNTLFSKKVKMLTITRSFHKYLITFEKDEIAPNVPNQKITMSKNHKVLYNGLMMDAENVGGTKVPYDGQLLYNILLEDHGIVLANNLISESLDPTNVIAKLYTSDYSDTMKDEIIQKLNDTIHDMPSYKKLAIELLA
jgi:hypothetical protein